MKYNKKILIISLLVGIISLGLVSAISTSNLRETRVDGIFNDIQSNTATIGSLTTESIVTTYLYASRINLNNGAFNIQGNHMWNSFSNLGIIVSNNNKFAVTNLETGNNTGESLCVDVNNYLCRCGFCA